MVDNLLLKAIARGELPDDPIERLRVSKRLPYFRIDEQGQVWILGKADLWLKIPPMKHR
jgi:hypothetical protein